MPTDERHRSTIDPAALDVLRTPTRKALAPYLDHEETQVMHPLGDYAGTLTKVTDRYAYIDQPALDGLRKFRLEDCTFILNWTKAEVARGYAVRLDRSASGPHETYRAVCITCYDARRTWLVGTGDEEMCGYQAAAHVANAHDEIPSKAGAWDTTRDTRPLGPGLWETFTDSSECTGYTIRRNAGLSVTYEVRRNDDPLNAQRYHHVAEALTWRGAVLGLLVHADAGDPKGDWLPEPWQDLGIRLLVQEYIEQTGLSPVDLDEVGHWDVTFRLPESPDQGRWRYDGHGTLAEVLGRTAAEWMGNTENNPLFAKISDHSALH